jgi:hypothetical protein
MGFPGTQNGRWIYSGRYIFDQSASHQKCSQEKGLRAASNTFGTE